MTEKRFHLVDRRVSSLTRFSNINCRYWVMDRENPGVIVDEFNTKRPALMAVSHYNRYGLES